MHNHIDLPNLRSIEIKEGALSGDYHDDQCSINHEPFNSKNELIMKGNVLMNEQLLDLPSLTALQLGKYSFTMLGSAELRSGCYLFS